MFGLMNYNPGIAPDPNRQQGFGAVDPMGAMMGLMAMNQAFNRKPRYTTSLAEASSPDDSGMRNAMGLMTYQANQRAQQQRMALEKERLDIAKNADMRAGRQSDFQYGEQLRKANAEKELAAAIPSNDPARVAAARAAANPEAAYQSQYGWQKPQGQIDQERDDATWKSNLAIRGAQQGRIKTPEELKQEDDAARRASNLAVTQGRALQVLSPEAEAQRLRMQQPQVKPQAVIDQDIEAEKRKAAVAIDQAQKTRVMTPEELDQKRTLEREKALMSQEKKDPTEGERKAAGYYDRMAAADKVLSDMAEKGYDGRGYGAATANALSAIPFTGGVIGNVARGKENQQVRQAQLDWAGAKLRFESGATVTDGEIAQEASRYFPQPGDSDAVVKQKVDARLRANDAMRENAGRARAGAQPAAPAAPPKKGDKVDGYQFVGGDPSDPKNWWKLP